MSTKKPDEGDGLTADDQAFYAAWSERIEADDYGPISPNAEIQIDGDPEAVFAELEAFVNRGGRPTLTGTAGAGESPVLRFRVPPELRNELAEFAKQQNRKQSVVMRDALAAYLHKAS
ncbi:hypothetical protein [Gryllotalpicola protaetiae]|uniref:Ribbon-helix-helix protein, CopG family n=1 Tax=Gryllotalpicola protaetiae TaxID=2419771 RepID=A0A387BS58_9MICO|nr:hypothetical protein [Gryllotalpicola protaetiae]AYG05538.1 hypothetical protein D7I44_17825 [Gryllotalpicola protaetiae]